MIKPEQKLNRSIAQLAQSLDFIAVTAGPGLMTSLLVGVEVARTLSYLWKKPLVAVNHLAGHLYANWLPSPQPSPTRGEGEKRNSPPLMGGVRGGWHGEGAIKFPLLCLIVSGGHTELVLMKKHLDFKVIGSTRDDAAGEAFDKVAKMLGLGYPGGPAVSAMAEKWRMQAPPPESSPIKGEEERKNSPPPVGGVRGGGIDFPRPMINSNDFDFSFSGLKTAVLYYLKGVDVIASEAKQSPAAVKRSPRAFSARDDMMVAQVCARFEQAAVDVLVAKTVRAAKQFKVKTVLLGGGVAANKRLRTELQQAITTMTPATCHLSPLMYTGDNAAMIAGAGYFMARTKQFTPWEKLDVDPVRSL